MSEFNTKTEQLVKYLSLIPKNPNMLKNYEMNTIKGGIVLHGIVNNEHISIAQMSIKHDTETDWHIHDETKHFVLYEGKSYVIEYIVDNKDVIKRKVTPNETCYVLPSQAHRIVESDGDSESIVIMIPGSESFPKGNL